MSRDPSYATAILKTKAMLLLRREQELHLLRQERARTETWLDVFNAVSLDLGGTTPIELMKKWTTLLIERLSYQAAGVYRRDKATGELVAQWASPAERLGARLRLDTQANEHLRSHSRGRYDPSVAPCEAVQTLAEQLRLDKFYWVHYAAHGDGLLLVAGFSSDASSFHTLNDIDEGHMVMFCDHLGALVDNAALFANLENERVELRRSNLELDESLQVLRVTQRQLVQVSRTAGMAEMATGVLHNVGNILTSLNVSAEMIGEKLRGLETDSLRQAVELTERHAAALGLVEDDSRGSKIIAYLRKLAVVLATQKQELGDENGMLRKQIEHMKAVVSSQQEHARPLAVIEQCEVRELVDEAVALVRWMYAKHGIELAVANDDLPEVAVDRHRVLQILVNLVSNAGHAVTMAAGETKRVTIHSRQDSHGRFCIQVADNGVGIAKEHLGRIFTHGFTTRSDGHGFGLHTSSLSARSMGGQLTCASEGPGRGAEFCLQLPLRPHGGHDQAFEPLVGGGPFGGPAT